MKRVIFATAIGLGWASAAMSASVTGFNTEASYNAFTYGDTTFLDFNGLTPGSANGDYGAVDFNTIGSANPDNVSYNGFQITDAGIPINNGVGTLQGVFSTGTFAIGMDLQSVEGSGDVDVFDAFDNWMASVSYNSNGFVGILTDMPFFRFQITTATFGAVGKDRVFVDNFRISQSMPPVPLPASGLMLLGALCVVAARKRPKA